MQYCHKIVMHFYSKLFMMHEAVVKPLAISYENHSQFSTVIKLFIMHFYSKIIYDV